ncbi:unnamed protein product [Rhizoctonia solani]|uniref:Chromo domain-containing protein n=1 Tax=Rhizoctonia solani TaxID=456999 RepID=A0A8H3AIR9_9AGAM|nr:unnamed protein product [Rhizoctonia solani]
MPESETSQLEYIKCARIDKGSTPEANYRFVYEVKWVGLPDDPRYNEWINDDDLQADQYTKAFLDDFWRANPKPTPESKPDEEGCYSLGARFEASEDYMRRQERVRAAFGLPEARSRPQTAPASVSQPRKRRRSPSSENNVGTERANRRREEVPLVGEGYDPIPSLETSAPRPMLRPIIGSVLTFKKGKVVVQDKHRKVLEARQFRARGGLFLQQHLRKEREERLAAAKKRAEEAQAAVEEEARRVAEKLAEELAEAGEFSRIAEEARIAEENARLEEENRIKAARAAEWSIRRSEPPKPPSPPPLKALLGPSLEDDDLPDFEDDFEPASNQIATAPPANLFGAPNSLLLEPEGTKIFTKKKADPFYWANKLAEERKQKELRSRHPIFKLEINEASVEVFMKDLTNEPSRSPNAPGVSAFAGSIIDTNSTQKYVDDAITGIERGWLPSGSIARLAPVEKTCWAMLEVLALQMFVDGKVIISSENDQGWMPVIFASEEEGVFSLLSSSNQLANYKATLLITMVKASS